MKRALKSLGAAVQKREVVIINRTLDLPVLSLFINFSSSDHNCIAETAYSPKWSRVSKVGPTRPQTLYETHRARDFA